MVFGAGNSFVALPAFNISIFHLLESVKVLWKIAPFEHIFIPFKLGLIGGIVVAHFALKVNRASTVEPLLLRFPLLIGHVLWHRKGFTSYCITGITFPDALHILEVRGCATAAPRTHGRENRGV